MPSKTNLAQNILLDIKRLLMPVIDDLAINLAKWPRIIAVDFDGTLCENKWPDIGEPNQEVIEYILEEQRKGAKLILWTNRSGCKLNEAIDWCAQLDVYFDAVNENLPEVLKFFGGIDSRKITADEYIEDKACTRFKLPYIKEESSTMTSWAEKEIKIACEREKANSKDENEWDYGCACYESALKAFKSLSGDGHSGCSIGFTQRILNQLIDGKPLTPIEDTPDIWSDITSYGVPEGIKTTYQCKRMSSLFKYVYPDGSIKYSDVEDYYCVTTDNPTAAYTNGLVHQVIDEMFPIKMPYLPSGKTKVVCDEFLTDKNNGDYDTVAILCAIKPDGERIDINRYFAEVHKLTEPNVSSMVEITNDEYAERIIQAKHPIPKRKKTQCVIGTDLASGPDHSAINGKFVD